MNAPEGCKLQWVPDDMHLELSIADIDVYSLARYRELNPLILNPLQDQLIEESKRVNKLPPREGSAYGHE